jgi:IclR family acetate operon transcriptional repressor
MKHASIHREEMDRVSRRTQPPAKPLPGTSTLDLALRILEHLARESQPASIASLAATFSASKATVYRHLQTLVRNGFARQDPETGRYDVGLKLLMLGEASRSRFDVSRAARGKLMELRDETRQAVTICSLVEDELVVLELIQGQTVVEFGIRPGTRMDMHATAHGKIWLAFGRRDLMDRILARPRRAWTPETIMDRAALEAEADRVRAQGWAVAPGELVTAVNALAAPVFDYRDALVGSLAIVGFTQFIPAKPNPATIAAVVETARAMSRVLGWKG